MTMSSKEKNASTTPTIEWSVEEDIQLFSALEGLKPVGVNKHFYMACIAERLAKALNREIPAEAIWEHLRTMYNLDMLEEIQTLPFPNEQKDFCLPDSEFSQLIAKKKMEEKLDDKKSDNKDKTNSTSKILSTQKDFEKKVTAKLQADIPKRTPKRTRGSVSLESNSPSTTPPPTSSNKRRRI
ncbi:MRG/MORF4L-binding protein [Condylostylus longicornis]|uniref:MRG/MORF4L-binding protein n=1 Tax=Condylostylus longicornis TaxID=2530218 RepID=UPI00244E31EB|nr:MRG/MORF4L-binding protein [Condylostylus longicornis]